MEGFISKLKEDEIERSIVVQGLNPSLVDKNDVAIHFQSRRNGGGDVDRLEVFDNGATVIVIFEDLKCVNGVLGKEHVIKGIKVDVDSCRNMSTEPVQVFAQVLAKIDPIAIVLFNKETSTSVKHVAQKIGLQCMKDDTDNGCIVTGSYEQIVAFHRYCHRRLTKDRSKLNLTASNRTAEDKNGGKVLAREQATTKVPFNRQSAEKNDGKSKGRVSKEKSKEQFTEKSEKPLTKRGDEDKENATVTTDSKQILARKDSKSLDTSLHEFKIKAKEWDLFSKTNQNELQQLMNNYGVLFQVMGTTCLVTRNPSEECNEENLKAVSGHLAKLYNKEVQYMKCERFALADDKGDQQSKLRQLVIEFNKKEPVVLERAPDRQSWEIFGVSRKVDDILSLLEAEVGIRRLAAVDSDGEDVEVEVEIADDKEEKIIIEEDDDDEDPNKRLQHDFGDIKLSVYKGDITDENSDVIVNAANQRLCHEEGVSRAIVTKGGSSIQEESTRIIETKGELKTGDAAITPSGELNCKMIVHAVGPVWDRKHQELCILQLKTACISSLQQAEKYRFTSISFPAVGSGLPENLCAQAMFDVMEEYTKLPKDFRVRDIRFVIIDDKTVKAFQKVFKKRYGEGEIVASNRNQANSSLTPRQLQHQNQQIKTMSQAKRRANKPPSTSGLNGLGKFYEEGDATLYEVKQQEKGPSSSTALTTNRNASQEADKGTKLVDGNYQHSPFRISSPDVNKWNTDQETKSFKPSTHGKEQSSSTTFAANGSSPWSTSNRESRQSCLPKKDNYSSTVFACNGTDNDNPRTYIDTYDTNLGRWKHSSAASQANGWDYGTSQYSLYGHKHHPSNDRGGKWTSNEDFRNSQSKKTGQVKHISSRVYNDYGQMRVDDTAVNGGHGGARPKQNPKHPYNQYHTQGKRQEEHKTQQCPICYGKLRHPKTLPDCKHTFCTSCLDKALKVSMWCPFCKSPVSGSKSNSQGASSFMQGSWFGHDARDRQVQAREAGSTQGPMSTHGRLSSPKPDGTMTYRREHFSLPGYEDCGTILIQYSLRGGIQGPENPNPGQPYDSTSRGAYLPDNKQGAKVLKLLQAAFDRGLVFKIGRSMTSGQDNQIVWADIPHKTCISGGPANYGYPDPTYLTEVQHILQAMLSHDSSNLNNDYYNYPIRD